MNNEIKENLSELLFNRDERLLDYINELQDKLVKISNLYFKMSERYEKLFNHYCLDIKRISRVNKAINYVESFEYYIPEDNKEELIKILKGEDNEQ